MILEVSRKQDYIFASKKLRDNAARSADIAYVTGSEFFRDTAPGLYREEENLVYSGGGHTVLQFQGREQATAFAKCVTEAVLRQYDALELFVKQLPYDGGKSPGENLKALSAALERKKSLRRSAFRQLSFGVEALSGESFAPRVSGGGTEDSRPGQGNRLTLAPPAGWKFQADFKTQAGGGNFIAVIHIDGNAMGKRVDRVYERSGRDWEACRAALRRFSEAIGRDFEDAFLEMAEEVARQFPELSPTLPLRPVILAGDDVCFVCAGDIALECARVFLERLTAKTNSEDRGGYAACAGVALVHTKFPFHRAYDLAEELCSSAKRFGAALDPDGRVSAMDWHIEFGQLKDSLAGLREDYACDDGGRMELRPVAVITPEGCDPGVRSYGFFKTLCRALGSGDITIARGKIKNLRQVFKQGELESRFFLHDRQIGALLSYALEAGQPAPDRQEAREGEVFREMDGVKRCLFFDAIEMTDHFTAFEGAKRHER